ncbi:MAG: hypothetical protein J5737_06095 [Bacteroidales bacterium]|nr:hypothetical protein [Bacteroidales bacterium]
MTDKNWKDSLRQRMSEYTENPPEGLWEAIEAAGAGRAAKPFHRPRFRSVWV